MSKNYTLIDRVYHIFVKKSIDFSCVLSQIVTKFLHLEIGGERIISRI